MPRLRLGVVRYASVAEAIEQRLAVGRRPTCDIRQGRVYLVLRGVGASRWEPAAQLAYALDAATVAREALAAHPRSAVRAHARHAVVVRLEDVGVEHGCEVRTQWECIVPVT
jgi:hypothetical protein